MNFLEFVQFKNDDIRCRYTSKNGNRKILSSRNSLVLLKGLNKILSNEKYTIYEKRGKVFLTTRSQSICIHDYDDFRYDLKKYIPNVVKQIDRIITKRRIVAVKKNALTATVLTSLICTGLLINPINTNNIDNQQIIIENTSMQDSIKSNEEHEINNYEKVVINNDDAIQEAVDDANTTPTYNYNINIDCSDKSENPEIIDIQEKYRELANRIGNKWGVSSNLILAMLTQETHGLETNLMQINFNTKKDEIYTVYNFETNQYCSYVLTDNPNNYDSSITTISRKDIENPFTNISIATIYYRSVLNKYANNNPIAAIELYNKGPGNFNTNMSATENATGLSRDQILNDIENAYFIDYSGTCGAGDPDYIPNVLQYLNGDITILFNDDYNNISKIDCTINKTKKEELAR